MFERKRNSCCLLGLRFLSSVVPDGLRRASAMAVREWRSAISKMAVSANCTASLHQRSRRWLILSSHATEVCWRFSSGSFREPLYFVSCRPVAEKRENWRGLNSRFAKISRAHIASPGHPMVDTCTTVAATVTTLWRRFAFRPLEAPRQVPDSRGLALVISKSLPTVPASSAGGACPGNVACGRWTISCLLESRLWSRPVPLGRAARSAHHFNPRLVSWRGAERAVARHEWGVERFGQRDVDGIVGRDVVSQI